MANVNSVSNSYSSIYGSRNVLSGLASGLDTEAMIENSVSGYKQKITQLQQQMESMTWKQDAYRSITDKMLALMDTFTSYTSKTNLTSSTFFSQAVKTIISGTYASKVSATGKSSSDVQIKAATMATAAKYTVDGSKVAGGAASGTGEAIKWNETKRVSNISGSLNISDGERNIRLDFSESDVYETAGDLAQGINDKLKAQGIENITAEADTNGNITFASDDGKEIYISGGDGDLFKNFMKQQEGEDQDHQQFDLTIDDANKLFTEKNMAEYLSGKTIDVTYNGTTKSISLEKLVDQEIDGKKIGEMSSEELAGLAPEKLTKALANTIQNEVDEKFGVGKVTVDATEDGGLQFGVKENTGSTLKVTSSVGDDLGIKNGVSNYLDTSKTLGDLFGGKLGEDPQDLIINGIKVGSYGADAKLSDILSDINKSGAGVTVSFSNLTNEFVFATKETGENQKIDFGEAGSLASQLFGGPVDTNDDNYKAGTDAVVEAVINGKDVKIQRSSNTIDIEGLSVTIKGDFETKAGEEALSFKTSSDSDKVVDAVKSFVDQYNALLKEIHDAYSTQPLYDSSGKKYSALTDDDKSSMSDTAIERYEEKAKTGLLFGDSDLSSLYTKMTSIFTSALSGIGITATYSGGLTQISLDEDKLRETLENDPDKVKDAFTSSKALGGSSDGLMTKVKNLFDAYASKSIGSTGILVRKAGTKLSSYSLSNNEIQKQIDQLQSKIDSWQTKLNKKIDYYTRQFTALEQMMSTMNNQSSMLSGLMGGY